MYFPIRCFTCGAVIGQLYEQYSKGIKDNEGPADILDKLGVERYCCRRMFLSYVSVMDKIVKYRRY